MSCSSFCGERKKSREKIQGMGAVIVKKVGAVSSYEEIQRVSHVLRKQSLRDYLLFRLGVNLGLRVSDLLNLQVADLKGKERIRIKDEKSNRSYEFILSETLKEEIAYFLGNQEKGYVFQSRNSGGRLTRQRVYLILRKAAEEAGIDCEIGTQTLRKTFGYWAYKKGASLESIRRFLGHATTNMTLRYIGIEQEVKKGVNIFAPLDL